MSSTPYPRWSVRYFPDGLDDPAIEVLTAVIDRALSEAPAPTSALVDGSAAERRRRRIQRRALSGVVRSFPAAPLAHPPIEEIAS